MSRISRFKRVASKLTFIGRLLDKQLCETYSTNTCGNSGGQGFDAKDSQIIHGPTNHVNNALIAGKMVLSNDPSTHPNLMKNYNRHKCSWKMRRNRASERVRMIEETSSSVLLLQVSDLKQSSVEGATARLHQRETTSSLSLEFSKRATHLSASSAFVRARFLFEKNVMKKSIQMFRKEVSLNMDLRESVFRLRRAHIFCVWKNLFERQLKIRTEFRYRIDVNLSLKAFESWKCNKQRSLDSHMNLKYQALLKTVFCFWRDGLKPALLEESLKNEIKERLRNSIRT